MKASAIERDVLEVVSKNKQPMSVHDIARKVKSMRHKINPVIRALAKQGKLEIIEGGEIPLFVYRQGLGQDAQATESAKNEAPSASGHNEAKEAKVSRTRQKKSIEFAEKVSSISSAKDIEQKVFQAVTDAPSPLTIEQIAEQIKSPVHLVRRTVAKLGKDDVFVGDSKAGFSLRTLQTKNQIGAESAPGPALLSGTTQETEVPSLRSPHKDVIIHILEALSEKPSQLTDLHDSLGDIKPVLAQMKEDKLVDSTVIFRGEAPVYEILEAGKDYLKKHGVVNKPAPIDVTETPVQAPAPVAKQEMPKHQEETKVVEPVAQAPEEVPQVSTSDHRVLAEISELVNRLVDERIAKYELGKRALKTDIQGTIMDVTTSLKSAIESLQKLSDQLNQGV